jgi:thiopurine S-methyltransferase
MQPEFWHQRWAGNQIGFHESQVNPLLVAHFDVLGVSPGARVFLPLCGKTLDIDWLLARGYHVAGAELSSLAVAQLFERLGATPVIRQAGPLECRSAAGLDVFVGDIFELTPDVLGAVDAVYDRAALIALPAQMRRQYVAHLQVLAGCAPQLLVTLQYDQQRIDGPPFSVSEVEVREHFSGRPAKVLARHEVPGGLKGKCAAEEIVWKI